MTAKRKLPEFIKPMLAESGEAFDSDKHLFEIKWDGIRAMAYIEDDGYRLLSRRGIDITPRYPEMAELGNLPAGTILDGELVVLNADGKPDFRAVLSREQARSPIRYNRLARTTPVNFIAFDLLYSNYESRLQRPLRERRALLSELASPVESERFVVSDGIVGAGRDFFAQVVARDMEGIIAKRLDSRYFPGRRSDAWIKIRKASTLLCAIVGYVPKGDDFEGLIVAANDGGELRFVGRVGTGFDTAMRDRLNELLRSREATHPLVPCPEKGTWLAPGLYCQVRYLERTKDGLLREPVFERLILD